MDGYDLNSNLLAGATDAVPTLPATPGIGGGDILSLGVSMVVIVAMILVVGWLYSRSRLAGGGSAELINVIASEALGPKERLLVVEVADQQLLVGMTASTVQTLHVFDKPLSVAAPAPDPAGFATRLRAAIAERVQ